MHPIPQRGMILILLVLTLLASTMSAGAAPMRDVSVVLDWYPNAVHSFLFVADAKGYFRDEGLNVTFKMPAGDPTDGIKLVGAGKETFALYYQPDILMARVNEGIPIVAVAAIVPEPLNGIMVRKDSGIKSPKDLQGKRVGYPSIPLNISVVKTMVTTDGGNFDRVRMTDIGWDLIPAITLQRVDALSGGFINHEYPILEKEGQPMRFFHPADFGVPKYYELMLITGERTVQDLDLVKAFWRAATKGFEFVQAHPEEGLNTLLSSQRDEFPLESDIETFSLNYLLPRMQGEGMPFGYQDPKIWQEVSEWLLEHDALEKTPNLEEAFLNIVR